MAGDMTEITTFLTEVAKDNACTVKNEQKKIAKKVNSYHIDHIQMNTLDNLMQSGAECDKEIQYTNNEKKHECRNRRHNPCVRMHN